MNMRHTPHTPWASVHSPGPDGRWRSKRQNSVLEHYLCAIPLGKWANQWTLALQSADLPHRETTWTMSLWQGHQPFLVAACCTQCNPTANHAGCIEMSPGTEGTAPGPDKLLQSASRSNLQDKRYDWWWTKPQRQCVRGANEQAPGVGKAWDWHKSTMSFAALLRLHPSERRKDKPKGIKKMWRTWTWS